METALFVVVANFSKDRTQNGGQICSSSFMFLNLLCETYSCVEKKKDVNIVKYNGGKLFFLLSFSSLHIYKKLY